MEKLVETKELLGWSREEEQAYKAEMPDERIILVRPSDEGRYGSYEAYRNENWKIDRRHRKDYAFPFVDGTYAVVSSGDSSPVDGKIVTDEDIKLLHRTRDNEVYDNNKFHFRECDDYDFLTKMDAEYEKKRHGLPNQYQDMEDAYKRLKLVIGIESMAVDDETLDHILFYPITVEDTSPDVSDTMNVASEKGSCDGNTDGISDGCWKPDLLNLIREDQGAEPVADGILAAMDAMSDKEKQIFTMVYVHGLKRVTVAERLGFSEGTVRYYLKNADAKIRNQKVLSDYEQFRNEHNATWDAWEKGQKQKKKAHEKSHKVWCRKWREEDRAKGRRSK